MDFLKTLSVVAMATILLFACRKKDRHIEPPTDALSNKVYIGAYGRGYDGLYRYDTSLVLKFENKGLLKTYLNYDTARYGVAGKGNYTYDGQNFTATITFDDPARVYIFTGNENNDIEDLKIFGTIKYATQDNGGVFYISEWN